MKRQNYLKSMLCLLLGLVCHVAWAQNEAWSYAKSVEVGDKITDITAVKEGQNVVFKLVSGNSYITMDLECEAGMSGTATGLSVFKLHRDGGDTNNQFAIESPREGYYFPNIQNSGWPKYYMTNGSQQAFQFLTAKADGTTLSNGQFVIKSATTDAYFDGDSSDFTGWQGNGDNCVYEVYEVSPSEEKHVYGDLAYILTDEVGNTYEGSYRGFAGTSVPSFTGVAGYTLSDQAWNDNVFTATITFPFPVSSAEVTNPTMIANGASWSNPNNRKWHAVTVDGVDYVKVQTAQVQASSANEWLWAICPELDENEKFTFKIKSISKDTYVTASTTATGSSNDVKGTTKPVTLSAEGTAFTYDLRSGSNYHFSYTNSSSTSLHPSMNSSGDTDVFLGVYSGSHSGNDICFPNPIENINFDFPISTEGNEQAVFICPHSTTTIKYYVSGTDVKATKTAPTSETVENYAWAIYPALSEMGLTFTIRNIATKKYIYTTSGTNQHVQGVVTVEETATKFTIDASNQFKASTGKYLSTNTATVDDQFAGTWSSHGGTKNSIASALGENTYTLTDDVGNVYEGTYSDGYVGISEPTFTGVEYTLTNKAWDGNHFTATIEFDLPFPISKPGEEDWTFIRSYAMTDGKCYFHVDDAYTKVITRTPIAANGMTYLPTVDKIAKWQWAIYPAIENGKIVFTIKNRAANKFVGGTASTSTVNPAPLATEGGKFCWGACIGNGKGFYLADNTNMFLAANSSSAGDQNAILWSKSGSNHQGGNLEFLETSYTVTTDAAGYTTLYTPLAVDIPDGVAAYTGRLNASNTLLSLDQVSETIPANTAVLLIGAESTTYTFSESSAIVAGIEGNVFQGSETSVDVTSIEGSAYTYQCTDGDVAFAKVAESAIPGYTVYIAAQSEADVITTDIFKEAARVAVAEYAAKLKNQLGYYYCTIGETKIYSAEEVNALIDAAETKAAAAEIVEAVKAQTLILPEAGKAYKMAFKTKAGALHHIVADDATLALSASTDEADASVFYCMQSPSADYPYIFVSAEGGFLTFKALSDAYISRVTDFKVGGMAEISSDNITSSVDDRLGTFYIATDKRPGSTDDTDGCFVFKNQNNTYDGADAPFHNDNFTSAIVMTEVEAENKTLYEVVVDGDANAYVAYDNGTVVRKAFNDGFFVTPGATITEAQLSAGFVGNCVKSATITMVDNVITLSDVVTYPTPVKTDLYNTSNGSLGIPPHRIPGITVDPETGRIITTAARLVCGTDPGYGQVDVVCRISDDQGENWTDTVTVARGTGITSPEENYFDTAFGDPAVVADRTSDEVLIIVVAGCTRYQTATRAIPNMIGTIHSTDNGDSWEKPVDVTEDIYRLFDSGYPMQSAFVGGGKVFQSRIVKVGEYYRLYAAMCARPNGNRVIYSDDFGRTWHALGGASALPAPGGDEPKCEEMPDGRVILSSRVGGGRIYNIYTYTNTATAEGSWDTAVTSTFEGSGKAHNGQSTNGEILIVPVVRNSDQKDMYLTLQSLPAGAGRSHVGIFYKELTDMTDINTVANFAIDWNGYFEVTDKSSAYSSMDLQNDDRIGFIYEENYTKHGDVPNPHSIPFPDANNLGTHSYDGYDNIYVAYPLEIITNGAYSINRDVDRREFLRNYFTDLTADAADEVKDEVATCLEGLSTEPTIGEVDNIYFNISKGTVITDLDANAGKIGGFTDAVIADYKAAVMAATTADELAAAKATALASAEWNMPVSGKAYTFKNVQKDGTTVRWYKYDAANNNIVLTATESEATPFVCSLLENGKYVFVCSDGKYMTWRADASGHTTSGVLDAYDMTANKYYTDITIAKMTTGGSIANGVDLSTTCYVSISASRDDRDEIGYVVVKKNGGNPTFDGAGAAYWNDNFSSAFILEEAEVAFGNAPKVNDVEEGELLSEDLHNKHMSTFSATYATVVPEGVTAYYATREGENVALNAIAAGKAIPANTGVILVSEEGGNVVMLPAAGETVADVTGNLMGHSAGAAKDMGDVANAYLLTKGGQGVGFYRCSGGTLAANKAYLQLESTQQALRIRVRSAGEQGGGTTGIEESTLNSQPSTSIYDLYGRKVSTMQKGGVYIVNGKKVVK